MSVSDAEVCWMQTCSSPIRSSVIHVNLRGSDGSMLTTHEVAHMSFSANGINSISFGKPHLTCP